MFAFLHSATVVSLLLLSWQLPAPGEDPKAPVTDPQIAAADELYRAGKFAEAEASYEVLLKSDSKLVPAQVGLIRALLGLQKIDEALEAVNTALIAQPNSAALLAAKGDVQFRDGGMSDSETSYLAALKLDPNEVRAHLGLARLYRSFSLYRKAYAQLQIAHDIAPDDFLVQFAWLATVPQKQRLAATESFLAGPHPGHEEEIKAITSYMESLKGMTDNTVHACRLVGKIEQTETKLEPAYTVITGQTLSSITGPRSLFGLDVPTKINDRSLLLRLDTGSGGIVVNRTFAEKAGLVRISAARFRGIGDRGPQSGYRAIADHIRIGEMEFSDCVVRVTDMPNFAQGLIGTDVFANYLFDIDLPAKGLKLSPLPKGFDNAVETSLNSEGEEPANATRTEDSAPEQISTGDIAMSSPNSMQRPPKDRYIAPEMANWTQVFRVGNLFLVPTSVNESKPSLFILDTGSPFNALSTRAGRQAAKVHSEDHMRVAGLSGAVKKVYSSDKVDLRFGHFEQKNNAVITLDLSAMNGQNGTEVSGLLGFQVLQLLELKLDYRDGLVDFELAAKHTK